MSKMETFISLIKEANFKEAQKIFVDHITEMETYYAGENNNSVMHMVIESLIDNLQNVCQGCEDYVKIGTILIRIK